MHIRNNQPQAGAAEDALGYAQGPAGTLDTEAVPLTVAERENVLLKGAKFATLIKGKSLLIAGDLDSNGTPPKSPETQVRQSCLDVLGYPPREHIINVLLDSNGGNLDSAYKIVLYLSRYAKELNVYVPRKAKSASTLVALGAHCTYLSEFAQLGPLDTQIRNPRDPAKYISALDCYQSVEHVRGFGFNAMTNMLTHLLDTDRPTGQIPLPDLLDTASRFALGAIEPMLRGVNALDFGAWGRSLQIGENYARILLKSRNFEPQEANRIAYQLVYGYTHHLFPIEYLEAQRIGLDVKLMKEGEYEAAREVTNACCSKPFIGFISDEEAKQEEMAKEARSSEEEAEDTRSGVQAYAPQTHTPEYVPPRRKVR